MGWRGVARFNGPVGSRLVGLVGRLGCHGLVAVGRGWYDVSCVVAIAVGAGKGCGGVDLCSGDG